MAAQIGSVLVAGASVSGPHVAEQLRAAGYTGTIALVGAEKHLPYDRPPLSQQVLVGTKAAPDLTFRGRDELDGLDVALHLGLPATGWDGATLNPRRRQQADRRPPGDRDRRPATTAAGPAGAPRGRHPAQPRRRGVAGPVRLARPVHRRAAPHRALDQRPHPGRGDRRRHHRGGARA